MPDTLHAEKHFNATETVRDIVIGMADGLTVPFALAAGLSGATTDTTIIVTAGLAEIAAGAIAMGLGGYLAARTDAEHYTAEMKREYREILEVPAVEAEEVADVFRGYGLTEEQIGPIVAAIRSKPKRWVDFMMRFELGLEEPDPKRPLRSAATIAASYVVGGLVPLTPYMLVNHAPTALWYSVGFTLAALVLFGYIKARFTGMNRFKGAVQTAVTGALAAAAAFLIARLVA